MKKNSKTTFIIGSGQNTAEALPVIWERLDFFILNGSADQEATYGVAH